MQTPSAISGESNLSSLTQHFSLLWSAYMRLLSVKNEQARTFYETEALLGGWLVRRLDRQISSQFYERSTLSRNKAAMLEKGEVTLLGNELTSEEAIKAPYILEFLDLKNEYSESDLEDALIRRLSAYCSRQDRQHLIRT